MIHPDAGVLTAEAARQLLAQSPDLITLPATMGKRNAPQAALLLALLEGAETVARTLSDNAWDDGLCIPAGLGEQIHAATARVGNHVTVAMAPLVMSEACINAEALPAGYRLPTNLDRLNA